MTETADTMNIKGTKKQIKWAAGILSEANEVIASFCNPKRFTTLLVSAGFNTKERVASLGLDTREDLENLIANIRSTLVIPHMSDAAEIINLRDDMDSLVIEDFKSSIKTWTK